ncbi:phage holin, lambda family [Pseudomonas lundensis]|uniref:Lambda family phage holin n=1 Tax=Pseudomonas lundensis TaxID=86185 RepID=A0AAX2H8D4_9PSED|nr:phage holin, lambda family [Pseudomonas lundensis]NNA18874.1 phage holin, lambda family [Pseudomonas lundensis]SOB53028.1 Lambda family phage holin [Pseudomonas lundensis]
MPSSKDPAVWVMILTWISQNAPVIYATCLSVLIASLRIVYRGGTRKAVLLESLLCGCFTLAMLSGLSLLGLPQEAAAFVGGMVGLLGVDKVRHLAEHFAGLKVTRRNGDG